MQSGVSLAGVLSIAATAISLTAPLEALAAGEAGYWLDEVLVFSPANPGHHPYERREGYEYQGGDGKWHIFGNEHDSIVFSDYGFTDTGASYSVYAEGATSISKNRAKVAVSAGNWSNNESSSPYASVATTWRDTISVQGGSGTGLAKYTAFLDFSYDIDTARYITPDYLPFANASLTFGVYSLTRNTVLAEGSFSFSGQSPYLLWTEDSIPTSCQNQASGLSPIACSGSITFEQTGLFEYVYGEDIQLYATVFVEAGVNASIDALHTGGFSGIALPVGAYAVYASGRSDNPLNAVSVSAVPEPTAFAMLVAGMVLLGTAARRHRSET